MNQMRLNLYFFSSFIGGLMPVGAPPLFDIFELLTLPGAGFAVVVVDTGLWL